MRKWLIAFGAISDAFLLSVGSFFFGLGALIRINGLGTRPAGLEYLLMIFGGSIMLVGIFLASKLIAFAYPRRRRYANEVSKWITVLGGVLSDAGLFYLSYVYLKSAVENYLHGPNVGNLRVINGFVLMSLAGVAIVGGIIIAWKLKIFIWSSKTRVKQDPPAYLNGESGKKEKSV